MPRTRFSSIASSHCSADWWQSTPSPNAPRRNGQPTRPERSLPMADRALAGKVLETEAAAILALVGRIDEQFERAVELLHNCRGRVIVTGMGKSGIISHKIAATLTSIGTPAFFLHPAEAIHGDLGVIQADDVVVALSYSGETGEVLRMLEAIRRLGAKLIAIRVMHLSYREPGTVLGLGC